MKQFLPVLILFTLLAFGCKSQKEASVRGVAEDFTLHMKRTACFGKCPVYELYVDAKGAVKYVGYLNVENVGNFEKTLKPATVRKLAAAVEEAGFFAMDKMYDNGIADLPGVEMTVSQGGSSKSVIVKSGAPEALSALHKQIDELIGADGYQAVEKN